MGSQRLQPYGCGRGVDIRLLDHKTNDTISTGDSIVMRISLTGFAHKTPPYLCCPFNLQTLNLVDMPEGQNGGPMLAQQAGIYRERAVNRPLRDHFSCVWIKRLTKSNGMPFVVVPDGTIDLQWINGRWRVAGPDRQPMVEAFPARTVVVGFRFHA